MEDSRATSGKRASTEPRQATSGELMTVEQAADYLNINEAFVRRLIQERRLPFLKVGRLVRLRQTALDRWLAAAEVPATRPAHGTRRGVTAS